MEKSVKSLLFNLLVPFVQWEGVGPIEGAERKSGRSGEEENQNTKFSAWVVFSKRNLKSSETQWSPLFPPLCYVCVNIHRRLVGGGLPFQECPAVDVFGICGPCCSIVCSPQQLNLGAACDPCGCLYLFFSLPVLIQPISWRVEWNQKQKLCLTSPPPRPAFRDQSLLVHICLLALRPKGSQHGCWALLLTKPADWQLNMFLT